MRRGPFNQLEIRIPKGHLHNGGWKRRLRPMGTGLAQTNHHTGSPSSHFQGYQEVLQGPLDSHPQNCPVLCLIYSVPLIIGGHRFWQLQSPNFLIIKMHTQISTNVNSRESP